MLYYILGSIILVIIIIILLLVVVVVLYYYYYSHYNYYYDYYYYYYYYSSCTCIGSPYHLSQASGRWKWDACSVVIAYILLHYNDPTCSYVSPNFQEGGIMEDF